MKRYFVYFFERLVGEIFLSAIVLVQLFHLNGATAAPPVSE
ncbi:hypothetical protein [Undibacterium sp. YM2]|nr:hypothetical protein [Undibacterium sp. YM2]